MNRLVNFFMLVFGIAINAFGVQVFVFSNQFLNGGITGLSRAIHLALGFPLNLTVAILSFLMFAVGSLFIGKEFSTKTIAGTILFPIFLELFSRMDFLLDVTDNMMLASVFGGLTIGLGVGLVIRAGGSTGGSDVIPLILSRRFGLPTAPVLYGVDCVILCLQAIFATSEEILFGLLVVLIYSVVMEKVLLFGGSDVQFFIISKEHQRINQAFQKNLDVGATLLHGKTGHLGQDQEVILCTAARRDITQIKRTVMEIDPDVFMTAVPVSDVRGRGFTFEKRHLKDDKKLE